MSSSSETEQVDSHKSESTSNLLSELLSPVNLLLTVIIVVLVYKIFRSKFGKKTPEAPVPELPKLRKDMTIAELRQYDGTQPDGRILVAVNGWIFDATRGRRFYGPGGPYATFGGKDASRGLATFSVTLSDKEYDDLSDLTSMQMNSVKEWEAQFRENYDLVGRLLKPGEEPANYSDEETEEVEREEEKETARDPEEKKDK